MKIENERYMAVLQDLGVLASEMEASHLFILATRLSSAEVGPVHGSECLAGCVLGIVGDDGPFVLDPAVHSMATERAISIALEAISVLHFG
jgi:uridine phosphorylase